MDDCLKIGMEPSLFQVILFAENASTVLCPPFLNWMPAWLHFPAHRGLALFAESLLGLASVYFCVCMLRLVVVADALLIVDLDMRSPILSILGMYNQGVYVTILD